MAKITKKVERFVGDNDRKYSSATMGPILASQIKIDKTNKTLLDHISDDSIHGAGGGSGSISPEQLQEIYDKIDTKADKDHKHDQDTSFFVTANQVIETIDRKFVSATEKDALSGLTDNVQSKLNQHSRLLKEAMYYKGVYNSYSSMTMGNSNPERGWTTFVNIDETNDKAKSIYVYDGSAWVRVRSDKNSAGWIAATTAPSTDVLWLDTSNPAEIILKYHNGLSWKEISGGSKLPISANDITEETDKRFITDKGLSIVGKLDEDKVSGGLMYNGVLLGGSNGANIDDTTPGLDTTYSSIKINNLLGNKQDKLAYVPENTAMKNKANGYAGLDASGAVPLTSLPVQAKHMTYVVANEADRLAITTDTLVGDYSYEINTGKLYIRLGIPNPQDPAYDANEYWEYIADSYKIKQAALNKYDAQYNPSADDDELSGYGIGSIWINVNTKKSYICTDATAHAAKWDLMGGQVNLNANQIIPFLFDETLDGRVEGQKRFLLPYFVEQESYIEVSLNGVELIQGKDYVITHDDNIAALYLDMQYETSISDIINGEIYHADVDKVEQYMMKGAYDSNNDGKVDRAEYADFVNGLGSWESGKSYKEGNLILKDGTIKIANKNFVSGLNYNEDNWDTLKAIAIDLSQFTTDDLVDFQDKRYVTDDEKLDIAKIKGIEKDIINLNNEDTKINAKITTINSYIPNSTSTANKLINSSQLETELAKVNLKDLNDTPENYIPEAFLQVNTAGNAIEYTYEPRFPIMKVTDRKGNSFEDIYDLEISEFEKKSFKDGKLVLDPKLRTTHLLDMPAINEHGAILVSNQTLMQYDLVPADELSISQENYYTEVQTSDWVDVNGDGSRYEFTVTHTLDSEALILSFTNMNKEQLRNVTYKIIDKSNVLLISDSDDAIRVTINCSLGVVNGYWNHIFDISKITLIDDKAPRTDRAYSSKKLEELISVFADKNDVYTKAECNNTFSLKTNEHTHANFNILNKISEDKLGNITYNGKTLLTEISGEAVRESQVFNHSTLTEIINVESIANANSVNSILASEIVIKNNSNDDMELLIKDGNLVLVNEKLPAQGVQKYNLGVSTGTSISVNGSGSYNYYMSSI